MRSTPNPMPGDPRYMSEDQMKNLEWLLSFYMMKLNVREEYELPLEIIGEIRNRVSVAGR